MYSKNEGDASVESLTALGIKSRNQNSSNGGGSLLY